MPASSPSSMSTTVVARRLSAAVCGSLMAVPIRATVLTIPAWCTRGRRRQEARRPSAPPANILDVRNATHEAIGAAMALAVCAALASGAAMAAGALGASVLGSRLPDVDQPGARIHRRTRLERRSIASGSPAARFGYR